MNNFFKQNNLFSLEESVEKIPIDDLRKFYCKSLRDWASDDTEIRRLASKVLTEFEVNGDSYGVPGIREIVELLVNKIEKFKKIL
jgi:hypothetical protein